MPACFFGGASGGLVRASTKIQSANWPSVVQVFWPLMTYSSPSRTATVRSPARSEPASGSENPWHHQMSRFAVGGRKRSLISCEPKWAITGPTMLALKASGSGGTQAMRISSAQIWRCNGGVQSLPPHSTGQLGTPRPALFRIRWVVIASSGGKFRLSVRARSRISAGIWVVKNSRNSSRNFTSSSLSASFTRATSILVTRQYPLHGSAALPTGRQDHPP